MTRVRLHVQRVRRDLVHTFLGLILSDINEPSFASEGSSPLLRVCGVIARHDNLLSFEGSVERVWGCHHGPSLRLYMYFYIVYTFFFFLRYEKTKSKSSTAESEQRRLFEFTPLHLLPDKLV